MGPAERDESYAKKETATKVLKTPSYTQENRGIRRLATRVNSIERLQNETLDLLLAGGGDAGVAIQSPAMKKIADDMQDFVQKGLHHGRFPLAP